jgi:hypothetical protein
MDGSVGEASVQGAALRLFAAGNPGRHLQVVEIARNFVRARPIDLGMDVSTPSDRLPGPASNASPARAPVSPSPRDPRATGPTGFARLLAAAHGRGGGGAPRRPGEGSVLGPGPRPGGTATAKDHAASRPGKVPTEEEAAEPSGQGATVSTSTSDGADSGAGTRDDARDACESLDPSVRHVAHLAPPPGTLGGAVEAASTPAEPVRARSLEELLPALVRRIAWAGDRHKGTVRLELGAGVYSGTTITVHADAGRVRVEIGGNEGPALDRLRTRLATRLRGQGLDVESVT